MIIEEIPGGGRTVIAVRRERLDAAVAAEFRAEVEGVMRRGARRLVLDLGEVGFVDSTGLGAIVGVVKGLGRGGSVELAGLSPAVRKVFDLTRLSEVFTIHDRVPGG
jgi:anti-sigma B factor antagonist